MPDTLIDSLTPFLAVLQSAGVKARDVYSLTHSGASTDDARIRTYWLAMLSPDGLHRLAQNLHVVAELREVERWVHATITVGDDVAWCARQWDDLSDEERARVEPAPAKAAS